MKQYEKKTYHTKLSDGTLFYVDKIITVTVKAYTSHIAWGKYLNSELDYAPLDLDRIDLKSPVSTLEATEFRLDYKLKKLESLLDHQMFQLQHNIYDGRKSNVQCTESYQ